MALDAQHRSSIYLKLVDLIGNDDANALMTQFPSIEADELVTRQFLRAELAELRAELAELRAELRTELHTEMRALSNRLMAWTIATMFTGIGLAVASTRAFG